MRSKQTTTKTPPPNTYQLFGRAVALHLEGKGEEALAELERARDAGAANAEIYAAIGYLRYEGKQFEQAVVAYRKLVELEPANATGSFNLAASLQATEHWEEAAAMFEKSLAADPNRYEAHLGLGSCRLHLGAARPALEAYDRCLRLFASLDAVKLEGALFGKAVALQVQKKFAEAAEIYGRILQQNPRSEEALANSVAVYSELKDYPAAGACAEELLKIQPEARAPAAG